MLDRDEVGRRVAGPTVFLLVYAYLLHGIRIGQLYTFGDLPPYFGVQAIESFVSTWQYDQLGYSYMFNVIPAYMGAITYIGGELAQNLFFIGLIPLGFLTFTVMAGRFIDNVHARHAAAGIYALNPITISEFINGGLGAFIAFVGLPLVVHYLFRLVERGSWLDSLKAGAAFGLFAAIPYLLFWLVLPFATYLLYQARNSLATVLKLGASGVIGIVLALPGVYYMVQRAPTLTTTGMLFNQLDWSYASAKPLLLLRLAGDHGNYGMNQLGYNSDPALVVGLVIPIVALLAWHKKRTRFLYVIIGVFVLFMTLTHNHVTYPLFERIPLLFSLRSPTKLQYPLALSMSVLFGVGLQTGLDAVRDFKQAPVVRVVLIGIVLVSLFSYLAPAAGAMGLKATRGDNYYVHDEYEAMSENLDGKVLWIPYSPTTQLRLRYAYPNHIGIRQGGLTQGMQNGKYVTNFFRDFAAGKPVLHRLRDMGVQYVVVDSHQQQRWPATQGPPRVEIKFGAPWVFGAPEQFERWLDEGDAFTQVYRTEQFTVYQVESTPEQDRFEQYRGFHRVYYPNESAVERVGDNLLTNPSFDEGFEGWWIHSGNDGTQYEIVETDSGDSAAQLTTTSGQIYSIAQKVAVEPRRPYLLNVDATEEGRINLYWYNGTKSSENRTAQESYDLDELPRVVIAKGDTVSIRVVPNSERLTIQRVELTPSTYPAATSFVGSTEGIPGVTVDGYEFDGKIGTVVAVNMDEAEARAVGADVRIVDAETVLTGELVFDETYRQGGAVRMPEDGLPDTVPENAEVVTHETEVGTVVDYWIVGEFGETPVTVLHTSYDERWEGPADAEHFRANGWANGFIGAEPDEIRWTGGTTRRWAIFGWLAAWIAVLGSLIWSARWTRGQSRAAAGSRPTETTSDGRSPEDNGQL